MLPTWNQKQREIQNKRRLSDPPNFTRRKQAGKPAHLWIRATLREKEGWLRDSERWARNPEGRAKSDGGLLPSQRT